MLAWFDRLLGWKFGAASVLYNRMQARSNSRKCRKLLAAIEADLQRRD